MNNFKVYRKKYLLGDIHGSWGVIMRHIVHNNDEEVCYIQVGDFGIGFYDMDSEFSKLSKLNEKLVEMKSDLLIVRGNHDDPKWFKEFEFTLLKEKLTNIFFIPDYTVLNINLENILFVGGAISVDRVPTRLRSGGWWPDEVINFDFEKVKTLRGIDRMICHTAPDFCDPIKFGQTVYDFAKNDKDLLTELRAERANMTKLVTELTNNNKLKGYYYGHFHQNYRFYHNSCEFVGLGIDRFIQL